MASVESFVFNMFSENTFVVYDETKECIIIDPGCYDGNERKRLEHFIKKEGLTPVQLINTHCHVDHVFGNRFVAENWNLSLTIPDGEQVVLDAFVKVAQMYAIPNVQQSPDPEILLKEDDIIEFGNTILKVISAPGHSPAGICLYCAESNFLIAGDVIFEGSIGRTDLPGGDHDTLINNIKTKILTLPDNTLVYSGHGNTTTISRERRSNPFLQ